MSKQVAIVVIVAIAMTVASQAAAAPEDHALRFPGRRPITRPRNPIFPGYPGSRPSPPSFPGARPSPPSPSSTGDMPPLFGSTRPVLPPLFGFPSQPVPGNTASSPTDCVTPLAGLMTCGTFLTGSVSETPTPQSECCTGLSVFLNSTSAAGDGDQTLRCLCPVILGDVNRMLPKPIDPVRMMYLPIACGVVLPPQVLYMCFPGAGQPTPAGRVPEIMKNPSSGRLSP